MPADAHRSPAPPPAPDGPLIVQSDKSVLLEVARPGADEARRAIAPFAELERAPEHVHTYRITPLALWNARAAGLDAETVVHTLITHSRFPVPHALLTEIAETMGRYGRLQQDRLVGLDDEGAVGRRRVGHDGQYPKSRGARAVIRATCSSDCFRDTGPLRSCAGARVRPASAVDQGQVGQDRAQGEKASGEEFRDGESHDVRGPAQVGHWGPDQTQGGGVGRGGAGWEEARDDGPRHVGRRGRRTRFG